MPAYGTLYGFELDIEQGSGFDTPHLMTHQYSRQKVAQRSGARAIPSYLLAFVRNKREAVRVGLHLKVMDDTGLYFNHSAFQGFVVIPFFYSFE
jgi:hypothetical protein